MIWVTGISGFAEGMDHAQHAKHNMVLFGESEVFASHIVYKEPHNYQVILKIKLDAHHQALYLAERSQHPKDQFIYLLDPMNIKDIESAAAISGTISRMDASGVRREIAPNVVVTRENFEVIYFDELPLSLSGT
jgi:hypothetical protein